MNKIGQIIENSNIKNKSNLAKELGITPQLLYKYEKNLASPSVDFIAKFAEKFNVSIESLIGTTVQNQDVITDYNTLDTLKNDIKEQIILKLTNTNEKSLDHIISLGETLIKLTQKVVDKL